MRQIQGADARTRAWGALFPRKECSEDIILATSKAIQIRSGSSDPLAAEILFV